MSKPAPAAVCIFGLSANPPTGKLGHQGIVKMLVDSGKFDEVKKVKRVCASFIIYVSEQIGSWVRVSTVCPC